MQIEQAHLDAFCEHLQPLLQAELDAGNRVRYTQLLGEEITVMLAEPFKMEHSPGELLKYQEVNDPHWWKSHYWCSEHAHMLACQF
jgi:hypothetical protein